MSELYDNIYQSRPPIIDGLLHAGTYLFVGAPKIGKSFLMAQLAYHVSTGIPLWNYVVHKGTVLYLALEDDYRRLQNRLYRMFGTDSTENLHFAICAKQLGSGLDEQLQRFIREHSDTKLIIIDTLQMIRGTNYENTYANDYRDLSVLKHLADAHGIAILPSTICVRKPPRMCSAASPAPPPSAARWTPASRWWRNGGAAAGRVSPALAGTSSTGHGKRKLSGRSGRARQIM